MGALFEPLRSVAPAAWVRVLGGLALLTGYLYAGSADFHRAHLGPSSDWHALSWQHVAAFLLLGAVPLAWARWGEGRGPSCEGWRLGDWRFGLRFLVVSMVVLAPVLWINAGSPAFQAEYPLVPAAEASVAAFFAWQGIYLVYYLGWESFFRGTWLLGLERHLGAAGALALQTGVSTVMHIGKPAGETASAILAGVVFGLVALRTRSVLWVLLVHWYVGALTDLFCILRGGAG